MSKPDEQTELDRNENPETASQDVRSMPPEIADVMREMPPQFRDMMASFTMGPPPNPILDKVREEHITKALELASQAVDNNYKLDNREFDIKSSNRWFALAVLVIVLIVLVILVVVLQDKPDVLLPTITGLVGLGAGALGGYGYGKSKAES